MRTRAVFYIILGDLILAGLLVLDLVAHSYTTLSGPVFELIRAAIQGAGMMWFARGAEAVFFRSPSVSGADEVRSQIDWPVRLVQRFTAVLGVAIVFALAPYLFHVSLTPTIDRRPRDFSTVISID